MSVLTIWLRFSRAYVNTYMKPRVYAESTGKCFACSPDGEVACIAKQFIENYRLYLDSAFMHMHMCAVRLF